MHYKNGREAHDGDPVVAETWKASGKFIAGVLHSTNADCTSCNGQIAVPMLGGCSNYCVTIGDIYHAEDAFNEVNSFVEQAKTGTLPGVALTAG